MTSDEVENNITEIISFFLSALRKSQQSLINPAQTNPSRKKELAGVSESTYLLQEGDLLIHQNVE